MSADPDQWYYCDAMRDDDTAYGPVSLERLAELIRTGDLPYDVLVSHDPAPGPSWVEADTVEGILAAIPLDRERLMAEYIGYGEAPEGEENWGWASDRMFSILEGIPELAWTLIIDMIERAPSDDSLCFLAASPLEDLLSERGPDFIDRVDAQAAASRKFRRALGMLYRGEMADDVWRRVQLVAEPAA